MSNPGLLELPAEPVKAVGQAIQNASRILVVSHIRPDGDAIGSVLALGLSLRAAGKDVRMVLSDGVPSSFHFLQGVREVHRTPKGDYDAVIVVDCSELSRAGSALENIPVPDINIDHHITNTGFARINLVEPRAVATTEILSALLDQLGLPLTQPVVDALLTGLITDTIGFRTSNMTSEALRMASWLVDQGANLPELYQASLVNRTYAAARLWGAGLNQLEREGRLVWTVLTLEDRKASGYRGKDDADLVNVLSAIDDADIAIIFLEQGNDHIKVSWRARPGFDISQLAVSFGGGGHPAASGADIPGTLEEVKQAVLEATRRAWQTNYEAGLAAVPAGGPAGQHSTRSASRASQPASQARDHTHKGTGKSNGKR